MLRTSDCDILLVPGLEGSGPDHWQTRWEAKLSTARRVEQESWTRPVRDAWASRLSEAVHAGDPARPIVLVAHSLGVVAVAHAAPLLRPGLVRGAFLVSPADVESEALPGVDPAFAPIPRDPLPFPSVLVASRTDPHCTFERAEDLAYAWGSAITDAGDVGHINVESGHGPWPEGTMRFAGFLKTL
jgi:predicted alpha/beta hydrolase family esterase